jgi:U3 small nucleolar RNA-associated protein 24
MAELEKLGPRYRIALRIARDERWERIKVRSQPPFPFIGVRSANSFNSVITKEHTPYVPHFPSSYFSSCREKELELMETQDDCIVDRVMKHKIYIVVRPLSLLFTVFLWGLFFPSDLKIYINTVKQATNDRELKRRVRKVPGGKSPLPVVIFKQQYSFNPVPIISVARGKYVVERLPDAPEK